MAADIFNDVIKQAAIKGAAARKKDDERLFGEADVYRQALEKASYGDAGREFNQGLQGLTSRLAGAGPLADSGAATALRARLLSGVYGAAQGRIQNSFADYLKQALNQRQQFRYQQQLQRQAQKAQGGGFNPLGFLGGVASFIPGVGPAIGAGLGALGGATSRTSDPNYGLMP